MGLYFTNKEYLERALILAKKPPESTHTFSDALILSLSTARYEQMDHLCSCLQQKYGHLSKEECFRLTRGESIPGKIVFSDEVCDTIWNCALEILESGKTLGSELSKTSGRNTSNLWGHEILEAKAAGQLAEASGLDKDTARKLGILHDFGRSYAGTAEHGIRGFEILSDLGWNREALGALTHSYLRGGRCTNLEQAIPGFYVDENGDPNYEAAEKDDISEFLENYHYSMYDDILNIADLMASSYAILQPAERIKDVMTRRPFCEVNHYFMKAELTNMLREIRNLISGDSSKDYKAVKADCRTSQEMIQREFEIASEEFYQTYQQI